MNKENYTPMDPEIDKLLQENDPRKKHQIPEGYFQQLPNQIMDRITDLEMDIPEKKQPIVLRIVKFGLGIAASLIVLIAAVFFMNKGNLNGEELFVDLEYDEQYEYLYSNPDELTVLELSELAGEETISEIEIELFSNIPDELSDEFELEDLEEFYE